MIKRITGSIAEARVNPTWLDLTTLADVEVTSEDPGSPVDGVFTSDAPRPWRAASPGAQTIRLQFHSPVRLRRILLVFEERTQPRTQEFVLRWRPAGAAQDIDLLRQQFTFAPPGTTVEREDYHVDLASLSALELSIAPHISGGPAVATLQQFSVT
jgi:hypothetical protein